MALDTRHRQIYGKVKDCVELHTDIARILERVAAELVGLERVVDILRASAVCSSRGLA